MVRRERRQEAQRTEQALVLRTVHNKPNTDTEQHSEDQCRRRQTSRGAQQSEEGRVG